jgi:hemoglobin-like flavoprotein
MLTTAQKQAILRTWKLAEPITDTVADLFYKRLFEIAPQYRKLFPPDIAPQKRKLIAMLKFVVKSLDWPDEAWRENVNTADDLMLVVLALGRRHVELYRVPDEAYQPVAEALLWTLDYGLGEAFTPDVKDAWTKVYVLLATTMKMGRCAAAEGGSAPALRANDG